jgi:hypothetical protein
MTHPEIEKGADDEGGNEEGAGIPEGEAEIEPAVKLNLSP